MEPINLDSTKLAEAVQGGMTAQDVNDTANEMWKLREEISGYTKELTVDELRELCAMVGEWYRS